MLHTILIVIGTIIVLGGVIMVFDARRISQKLFGFGDQNEASSGLKILGFFLSIMGALLIYFNV